MATIKDEVSAFGTNKYRSLIKARKPGRNSAAVDFEDLQKPVFIEKNYKVKTRIVYAKKQDLYIFFLPDFNQPCN